MRTHTLVSCLTEAKAVVLCAKVMKLCFVSGSMISSVQKVALQCSNVDRRMFSIDALLLDSSLLDEEAWELLVALEDSASLLNNTAGNAIMVTHREKHGHHGAGLTHLTGRGCWRRSARH